MMTDSNLDKLVNDVVESLRAARGVIAHNQLHSTRIGFYMDAASLAIKAITEYGKTLADPEEVGQVLREVDIAGTQTEREDITWDESGHAYRKAGFN